MQELLHVEARFDKRKGGCSGCGDGQQKQDVGTARITGRQAGEEGDAGQHRAPRRKGTHKHGVFVDRALAHCRMQVYTATAAVTGVENDS